MGFVLGREFGITEASGARNKGWASKQTSRDLRSRTLWNFLDFMVTPTLSLVVSCEICSLVPMKFRGRPRRLWSLSSNALWSLLFVVAATLSIVLLLH
jgi:hypothetical protein